MFVKLVLLRIIKILSIYFDIDIEITNIMSNSDVIKFIIVCY